MVRFNIATSMRMRALDLKSWLKHLAPIVTLGQTNMGMPRFSQEIICKEGTFHVNVLTR
jgi:hypothetical protein